MELKTAKAKFTIEAGKELQSEITIDELGCKEEKDFLKMENETLKCELDKTKYELEKFKKNKASEYLIYLKDDMAITANVEEKQCAGAVMDGLIYYGDVTVSLDSFKCAVPIEHDNK